MTAAVACLGGEGKSDMAYAHRGSAMVVTRRLIWMLALSFLAHTSRNVSIVFSRSSTIMFSSASTACSSARIARVLAWFLGPPKLLPMVLQMWSWARAASTARRAGAYAAAWVPTGSERKSKPPLPSTTPVGQVALASLRRCAVLVGGHTAGVRPNCDHASVVPCV